MNKKIHANFSGAKLFFCIVTVTATTPRHGFADGLVYHHVSTNEVIYESYPTQPNHHSLTLNYGNLALTLPLHVEPHWLA